eukprot:7388881-Prymnesium_polylepis.1
MQGGDGGVGGESQQRESQQRDGAIGFKHEVVGGQSRAGAPFVAGVSGLTWASWTETRRTTAGPRALCARAPYPSTSRAP